MRVVVAAAVLCCGAVAAVLRCRAAVLLLCCGAVAWCCGGACRAVVLWRWCCAVMLRCRLMPNKQYNLAFYGIKNEREAVIKLLSGKTSHLFFGFWCLST